MRLSLVVHITFILVLFSGCVTEADKPAKKTPSELPQSKPTPKKKDTSEQKFISKNDSLDDVASVVAGMAIDSRFFPQVTASAAYKKFSSAFNERWLKFDSTRLEQLRNFRKQELDSIVATARTLFYPFSGPDVLYPLNFFQRQDTFILFGLEPVGRLPDLRHVREDSLELFFSKLNNSLNTILDYSFFRTE